MSGKSYKLMLAGVALVLFFGVSQAQWALTNQREKLGLNVYPELRGAPPVLAMTTVALGGFRGLISNALWMRATELQDQSKYFEMVQLADWITKLEPRFAQVWLMQGWNMAFNISVEFHDPADRWRWVERGMQLFRDDGLHYNPYDVLIHSELAWLFYFKMGGNMDNAHMYYKNQWYKQMNQVFGKDKPDWDELVNPQTDDARRRSALLREKYKMDPALMKQVDETYGPLEWRLPETHAIYWAVRGLDMARRNERNVDTNDYIRLNRIIYQSMYLAFERGRLITVPDSNNVPRVIDFGPNLAIVGKVSDTYEKVMSEATPGQMPNLKAAQRYFLLDAIYYFYTAGRQADATNWFKYLREKYPDTPMLEKVPGSLPTIISLDDFAIGRYEEEFKSLGQDKTRQEIEGLVRHAFLSLIEGNYDEYTGYLTLADKLWTSYDTKIPGTAHLDERLALAPLPEISRDVLTNMLTELPPELSRILAEQTGRTNLPPATNSPSKN